MNFKIHYREIPLLDFCETLHNRKQAPKVYVAQSISKEYAKRLKFDLELKLF